MKVAIYIRVSTEDQAKEGSSPDLPRNAPHLRANQSGEGKYSLEVQRESLESFV